MNTTLSLAAAAVAVWPVPDRAAKPAGLLLLALVAGAVLTGCGPLGQIEGRLRTLPPGPTPAPLRSK